MLKKITLKFGSSVGQSPLEFNPGRVTVFVGPNNSGKSLILRELGAFNIDIIARDMKILNDLQLKQFSGSEAKTLLLSIQHYFTGPRNETMVFHNFRTGSGWGIQDLDEYVARVDATGGIPDYINLFSSVTLQLNGETRLSLAQDQQLGDLKGPPTNLMSSLFRNDEGREKLREILHEAFGLYFVLDPTSIPSLQVRLHAEPLPEQGLERSLENRATDYFSRGLHLSVMSDGVKAYVGIMATLLSGGYRIVLIDEPEAFLHPPLARKLGKRLTQLAWERAGNVFASTHSSDFLMGCVQANPQVNVVRLTYKNGVATARQLPASKLEEMMRNPLLRSTGVLSGLFHEGAVVCEGDSDRAFYQEINERLLETDADGVDSCLFMNVNGKDQLRHIIKPLREMGIPAAAVVDLDVIKKGTLKPLLQAAFVPEILINNFRSLKDSINSKYDELSLQPEEVGIAALDPPAKQSAEHFIRQLEEYGIFVVPVGELEGWLKELNAPPKKSYWLTHVFEKMGSNPNDDEYIKPRAGDVWDFVRRIATWISDPLRKGIPE